MTEFGIPSATQRILKTVLKDTPCRKCRYNLRGLSVNGLCPECSAPIDFSIQGDLLQYCHPDWLYRLSLGTRIVVCGIILDIVAGLGGEIIDAVYGLPLVPLICGAAMSAVCLIGAWFLTSPDPSGLGEDKYGTSRKMIRIAFLVAFASCLPAFATQTPFMPARFLPLFEFGSLLCSFALLVGLFATLNYLNKLAARFPDNGLASQAKFLMYALGVSAAVIIGLGLFHPERHSVLAAGLGAMGCITILVVAVCGLTYLYVLVRFGRRLKECEKFARWLLAAPVEVAKK